MRSRKSQSYYIMALIVAVIIIIIFLLIPKQIYEKVKGNTPKEICKASVYASAALHKKAENIPWDLRCPTQEITIQDIGYKGYEAKNQIAKAMYDCWDQFGEGKLELFEGDGIFCAICSAITFEDKKENIKGFTKYLLTTPLPQKPSITYSEYLSGYKSEGSHILDELVKQGLEKEVINSSNKQAVIFTYIKGKDSLKDYLTKTEAAAPGVGATAIGFGLVKAGGIITGATWWTGVGLVVGKAIAIAGGVIMIGGISYSTYQFYYGGIPFEWLAQVTLREFNKQELENLGCEYYPATQKVIS